IWTTSRRSALNAARRVCWKIAFDHARARCQIRRSVKVCAPTVGLPAVRIRFPSTQYRVHSTQYPVRTTRSSTQILQPAVYSVLGTASSVLGGGHCVLCTVYSVLGTAYSQSTNTNSLRFRITRQAFASPCSFAYAASASRSTADGSRPS